MVHDNDQGESAHRRLHSIRHSGMVGEWVSAKVKRVPMGLGPVTFLGKMLAWGILGFIIKLAFKSFDGFAEHLIQVFRPT